MPATNGPVDPEDGDAVELTPEQREALRRSMDAMREAVLANVDLPRFALPESTLKRFAAISGIAEAQQAILRNAMKPFLDVQTAWQKQLKVIDSDIFRTTALTQSNINSIAAQLSKTMDFGISESFAKLGQHFAAQQSAWLKAITPALASLAKAFYPPNLRDIEDLRLEEVEQVVMVDGIALFGVPRTSIAKSLVRADGAAKRRAILGRRWNAISADCRAVVEACESEAVAPYRPFAVAALSALDDGHTEAAQALAGSLVDSLLTAYFGTQRRDFTPDRKGKKTKAVYDEFSVHEFIAFAPMWQAYQQFWVEDGDRVPTTFSRNATAHTVSRRQFSRRNAIQGLLFACSLIYFFDSKAAALASR